mgnify:CR=1 FL=1
MLAYQLGNMAAKKDCEKIAKIYSIDVKSFDCFLKTIYEGDPKFIDFWKSSFTCKTLDDSATEIFDTSAKTFDDSNN